MMGRILFLLPSYKYEWLLQEKERPLFLTPVPLSVLIRQVSWTILFVSTSGRLFLFLVATSLLFRLLFL